jgi:hypothetical protein
MKSYERIIKKTGLVENMSLFTSSQREGGKFFQKFFGPQNEFSYFCIKSIIVIFLENLL